MEVESKATNIFDAIERQYPDGDSWLRTWSPASRRVAHRGSGATAAPVTPAPSSTP
jgi:hypothetical protein